MSRPVVPIPTLVAAILVLSVTVVPVAAQDAGTPPSAEATPGVPFSGEGHAADARASSGPVGMPVVRWRHETCLQVFGDDLAASGGVVYVASDVLIALDAQNGTERWRFQARDVFTSVTVVEDVVYAGTADGFLYAVDAATGSERWRFEADASGPVGAPLVGDGLLYVRGGGFASDTGYFQYALYAIDAVKGAERWRLDLDGGSFGTPTLAEGTLYVGDWGGYLHALDAATGEARWHFPTPGGSPQSPAVADGTVYASAGPELYAVDAATGTERWRFPTGVDISTAPIVAAGGVYFGSDNGRFYALDAATGTERWAFEYGDVRAPAVAAGILYLGGVDGFLHALDATTGSARWILQTGNDVHMSSPVVSDGVVYIGGIQENSAYLLAIEEMAGQVGTPQPVATAPGDSGGTPVLELPPWMAAVAASMPNDGATVTPVSAASLPPAVTPVVPCQSRG